MTDQPRPIHLVMHDVRVFPEHVLCRRPGEHPVHVTEYGPQVTCRACRAIMRGLEPTDDQ